jgi:queuine/archaeosine tRNA-ribosyltransferase
VPKCCIFFLTEDILEAVGCGVDVFDTSYAYKAAEKNCAVVFPRGQRPGEDVELKYDDAYQFEMDLSEER